MPQLEKIMKALTQWNPWSELDEFSNRLASKLGRDEKSTSRTAGNWVWAPLVDVSENKDEYLIKAEVAGLEKDEIKISQDKYNLIISGERKEEQDNKGHRHHTKERFYGSFIRSFSLPEDVDASKIKAELKNGVLLLHLPKDESVKARPVAIEVS